ncbi:MAG TPA: N-formylglutamate deformylase [Steroidobacteraceae bacterium]|jgi:formiminoglutamase|nr:N-formylglutamate deformylase [Steroidobacteraceae bacterium]
MTAADHAPWLLLRQGSAPLLLCMPHTGTDIPPDIEGRLVSPWLARKDTDWWIERLYAFAGELGASLVRTSMSRTVIDCNRDPSGASLYPGRATTELCPTTTFDGELLYRTGAAPHDPEIAVRRREYFDPYHRAIEQEIARLRALHPCIVLYDCHSIRSAIPRLFTGTLPHFNIGTFAGASCAPELTARIERLCDGGPFSRVTNGRFKGGYTTRHYGAPGESVHAVQMELACRGYLREPAGEVDESNWPCPWDEAVAGPLRTQLQQVLSACLAFASEARR